ncbi:hypothetical protein K6X08_33345, partial [Burkholderia contaminans]|uniref:hypothetical protein n=2 Tax=Burkholderia contaminans TaxID=488447 RepID=UPI001C96DA9F
GVRTAHCRRPARDSVAPSRVRKTRILPCGGRTGQKLGDRPSRRDGFGRVGARVLRPCCAASARLAQPRRLRFELARQHAERGCGLVKQRAFVDVIGNASRSNLRMLAHEMFQHGQEEIVSTDQRDFFFNMR